MTDLRCRLCDAPLSRTFVDLGVQPLSNSYLKGEQLQQMEPFYPLRVFVCAECLLVQLPEMELAENIFDGEYAYFSSYSTSWLAHCEAYAKRMVEELSLGADHLVVEVASNDGYLLQYFKEAGVGVLGVEPAGSVVKVAEEERGIPTVQKFFGVETAEELAADGKRADLLIGNNVLAHVPDLRDFVAGVAKLLKPTGRCSFEFPHLLRLMENRQFDTIYHEHFSYFSFHAARRALEGAGLVVFDVEELSTHGGSLRVHARPEGPDVEVHESVSEMLSAEAAVGLMSLEGHLGFAEQVNALKRDLLTELIEARRQGLRVVGYGAPAKGNTLLNYCGVREDLLEYTVDRSPHKQGLFLPGTHIPIHAPEKLAEDRPDVIVILPWNLRDEILEQLSYAKEWGVRFVVPIPSVETL